MGKKFTVWITKYLFTTGIYKEEVEDCFHISKDFVSKDRPGMPSQGFHRNDWHYTESEAIAHALEMIEKKKKSIQKQLDKINKLEINLKTP